ncbi:MAG: TA0938 family protein, partial [Candidatus Thermoplasmatota archaeon]|nr:TA0938 family protein [Candidatus Thermoplasmatota archaeon]
FETMVEKVKKATGWKSIDYVELVGNYSSGRECVAKSGDEEFKYYFRTYGDGTFITFEKR